MLGHAPYDVLTTMNNVWFNNLPTPTTADLAAWNVVPGSPAGSLTAQPAGTVVKLGLFGFDLSGFYTDCYIAPSIPNSLCDLWSNFDGWSLGAAISIDYS